MNSVEALITIEKIPISLSDDTGKQIYCGDLYPVKYKEEIDTLRESVLKEAKYEKAIDKACDYLVKLSNKVPYLYLPVETKEQWKGWLLKDE